MPNEWWRYVDTSVIEFGEVRPKEVCQAWLCAATESRKDRKAGLPKREPPWSAGGHDVMVSSIEESMDRILSITLSAEETEEILLSAAASESEKTKERMREYVGEAWKSP